ncbi:MAG: transcriptional regulator [Cytophagaceae bacterium]|nr:MAG: transcriptional regulator [Cytophagaceae bacterium]
MTAKKRRSDCPISSSLDIWGDKWSLLIVRDLMFSRQCTYGDFLKSEEKIATNILASRLQMLEENGVIARLDHPESKAKVLYKLTQKGIDLLPIMTEINLWAEKYFTISDTQQAIVNEIKKDKALFLQRGLESLSEAS